MASFRVKMFPAGILLLLCTVVTGCSRSKNVASVNRNELFTLKYGSFEDELNVFNLSDVGTVNTAMTMRDGFFYIANGESKKIMELNSYGDLLNLYYNEDFNHKPSFANKNDSQNTTRKAIVYPFNTLGPIAVDSRKYLYAVDTLPQDRQEQDTEKRLLLSHIILRFSSDGVFMDYLGQQGPGGTPFPFIKNIYTTKNNELVVVCTTNDGTVVYWFNTNGFLLFTIPITTKTVPDPYTKTDSPGGYVSVENVIPDQLSRTLYLKIDYFENTLDPTLKVQSSIDYTHTLVYPLAVETGRYAAPVEIPSYEDSVSDGMSKELYDLPYDFLGVTDNGWFIFIVPTETGYMVQAVEAGGQKILKRSIALDNSKMLYYSFSLSDSGIISALFIERDHAEVIWWRTDSLIASFHQQ
jgi:hypothetical protein